jgi:ABC-2 type transport system permease protein
VSAVTVYARLVRIQIRAQLQYRVSFALSLAGTFLFTTLDLVAILVLFHNISAMAGWTASQVAMLYAAASMSFALSDMVLGSLDQLPTMVRDGTFDALLIRPRSAFFQLLAADFMLRRAGRLVQAVIVLAVVSGGFLHVDWDLAKIVVLCVTVLSGAVILGSVWVIAASVAFWVDDSGEFVNSFSSGALYLAQYPMDIYANWLRKLVFFVVPIGFVIYLPASWLLGKPEVSGLPPALRFASPAVAVLTIIIATLVWRLSVRRYRSAGG